MLTLQAAAGNRAVGRLLARTPSARDDLADTLRREYSVTAVRSATQSDQEADLAATTGATPGSITIPNWQSWDPDPASPIYADISAAFDEMDRTLGGIPPVREVRFAAADYQLVNGTLVPTAGTGADYMRGVLTVYRRFESAYWGLPVARSTAGARYDTGHELAVGNPGSGAPATTSGQSESRRRIIVHELSHGVAEQMSTPGANTPAIDPTLWAEFRRAAGWNSAGTAIVESGNTMDETNWNDPSWAEQPVSRYSLSNPGEDFAESLMMFIERPAVLRARSPARYSFFDAHRGLWGNHLLPRNFGPGDFPLPSRDPQYA